MVETEVGGSQSSKLADFSSKYEKECELGVKARIAPNPY